MLAPNARWSADLCWAPLDAEANANPIMCYIQASIRVRNCASIINCLLDKGAYKIDSLQIVFCVFSLFGFAMIAILVNTINCSTFYVLLIKKLRLSPCYPFLSIIKCNDLF